MTVVIIAVVLFALVAEDSLDFNCFGKMDIKKSAKYLSVHPLYDQHNVRISILLNLLLIVIWRTSVLESVFRSCVCSNLDTWSLPVSCSVGAQQPASEDGAKARGLLTTEL